jgi:hypothetical protein
MAALWHFRMTAHGRELPLRHCRQQSFVPMAAFWNGEGQNPTRCSLSGFGKADVERNGERQNKNATFGLSDSTVWLG